MRISIRKLPAAAAGPALLTAVPAERFEMTMEFDGEEYGTHGSTLEDRLSVGWFMPVTIAHRAIDALNLEGVVLRDESKQTSSNPGQGVLTVSGSKAQITTILNRFNQLEIHTGYKSQTAKMLSDSACQSALASLEPAPPRNHTPCAIL